MSSIVRTSIQNNHQTERPFRLPGLDDLQSAIVAAVAYADIFDYPLTVAEIHRYLIGVSSPLEEIASLLAGERMVPSILSRSGEYFSLPGREEIVAIRRRRSEIAARFWPRALRYGRLLASLPFVKMVAITGELAVDNADDQSDIDYFIVTEPDRLWLGRGFTIALVRTARLQGVTICPNYIVSERALVFANRTLYTAHELAQMVPIAGIDVYQRIRQLNDWSADFLPNAVGPPREELCHPVGRSASRVAEAALRSDWGGRLERWEMDRKIQKFTGGSDNGETAFAVDWCKGHFDGHGQRTLEEYANRLGKVEVRAQ